MAMAGFQQQVTMLGVATYCRELILINLLTAIELTPGGSSAVHIYTQTIHRSTETEYTERKAHNNKNT
jgi:hypothetical protein